MRDEDELREPTSDELQRAARLLSVLERRDEDGRPRFRDEDVLHFLPLVFLSVAPTAEARAELPDAVVRLLGLFAARAGVDVNAPPDDVALAVERYYDAHPINPELLLAFQSFVREELLAGGTGNEKAFAAFLGDGRAPASLRALESGARPKGSVPGGPLARLAKAPADTGDADDTDDTDDTGEG